MSLSFANFLSLCACPGVETSQLPHCGEGVRRGDGAPRRVGKVEGGMKVCSAVTAACLPNRGTP